MNIGRRFKLYRKNKKLTQQEAASLIGVKSYQLANYESNRSEPSIKVLIMMSKVYGTSIDNLLGNTKLTNNESGIDIDNIEEENKELLKKLKKLVEEYEPSK